MSVITKFLKLFQYEPEKDADSTFNISLALNENWDKVDNACAALNTGKAAADHTHTAADVGAHNPNLLINGDFKINQRGQASYTNGYCVDKWVCAGYGRIAVESDGIGIYKTAGAAEMYIDQTIERFKALSGKTVTLSAKVISGAGAIRLFVISGGVPTMPISVDFQLPSGGMAQGTGVLPDLSGADMVFARLVDLSGASRFAYAKLEIGAAATLQNEPPPDPATELLRCQRYYLPPLDSFAVGEYVQGDALSLKIPTPSTMRVTPVLTSNENEVLINANWLPVEKMWVTAFPGYVKIHYTEPSILPQYNGANVLFRHIPGLDANL